MNAELRTLKYMAASTNDNQAGDSFTWSCEAILSKRLLYLLVILFLLAIERVIRAKMRPLTAFHYVCSYNRN